MQRLMVTLLTLVITIVMAEPHTELADSDSPCLHKPCEHGVCVESAASVQVDIKNNNKKKMLRMFQYFTKDSGLMKANNKVHLFRVTSASARMDTLVTTVRQTGTSAGTARVLTEARVWMASPTTTARVPPASQGFDARSMLTSAPLTHV